MPPYPCVLQYVAGIVLTPPSRPDPDAAAVDPSQYAGDKAALDAAKKALKEQKTARITEWKESMEQGSVKLLKTDADNSMPLDDEMCAPQASRRRLPGCA